MKAKTERATYRWICNECWQIQPIGSLKHMIDGFQRCAACAERKAR